MHKRFVFLSFYIYLNIILYSTFFVWFAKDYSKIIIIKKKKYTNYFKIRKHKKQLNLYTNHTNINLFFDNNTVIKKKKYIYKFKLFNNNVFVFFFCYKSFIMMGKRLIF